MKIEYPPDRHLTMSDYAMALGARNTPTSALLMNLADTLTRIDLEVAEMEEPTKARDRHPIVILYAHELAARVAGYLNVPHDNAHTFCSQRFYTLEHGKDMFIDRQGRLFWSRNPNEHLTVVETPVTRTQIATIEREYGGVVTNFNNEHERLYV